MPKIASPTRQLIPFAPAVLRPGQLRKASFTRLTTLALPQMTLRALKLLLQLYTAFGTFEWTDSVPYRGLTALAYALHGGQRRKLIDYF